MSDAPKHGLNGAPPKADGPAAPAATSLLEPENHEDVGSEAESPDLPEVELGATPEAVKELIAACVRFVSAKYGVMLDGTPDTLSLLDQYVRDSRGEIEASPGALELLQSSIGAYLGEVLRQQFLGEWYARGPAQEWRIDLRTVFLTFNPVGMAREALLVEHAEGWHAHLEMEAEDRPEVEQRLASLGEVDDEQFFAPTTRYDVIELAVTALRARMIERGLGDVRFGPEDYRAR